MTPLAMRMTGMKMVNPGAQGLQNWPQPNANTVASEETSNGKKKKDAPGSQTPCLTIFDTFVVNGNSSCYIHSIFRLKLRSLAEKIVR